MGDDVLDENTDVVSEEVEKIEPETYKVGDIFQDRNGEVKAVIIEVFKIREVDVFVIKETNRNGLLKMLLEEMVEYTNSNGYVLLETVEKKLQKLSSNVLLEDGQIYKKDDVEFIEILKANIFTFNPDNGLFVLHTAIRDHLMKRDYAVPSQYLKEVLLTNADEFDSLRKTYFEGGVN